MRQLPGGERLKIFASAANKAGNESALSEPVEAQVQPKQAGA